MHYVKCDPKECPNFTLPDRCSAECDRLQGIPICCYMCKLSVINHTSCGCGRPMPTQIADKFIKPF